MTTTTQEIIKNSIGSTVRAALVFIGALLVKKGIITDAQNQTFIAEGSSVAIGVIMTLAALAWGWIQKIWKNRDVNKALGALSTTTRAEFEANKANIPEVKP